MEVVVDGLDIQCFLLRLEQRRDRVIRPHRQTTRCFVAPNNLAVFSCKQATEFMTSVDWENNIFLRSPDEIKAMDFEGDPYSAAR
ncbi:MAG: hypothetical protein AAF654_12635 [Myxococcota bacterium]